MIKQEKLLTLNGSLVGTGRELTLHEKKKRGKQIDNFVPKPHAARTARRSLNEYFEKDLTFAPKLNEQSIKLAEERMARVLHEQGERDPRRTIECQKLYTFKPTVSPVSLKIVQNLGTTFLARQQLHIERKQKLLEEAQRIPVPLLHRPKKQSKLVTPFTAFPPEDSYKLPLGHSSSEDGGGSNSDRLCLPPCPSTPTLTQNSSSEEVPTTQSSLKQHCSVDNDVNVVKSHTGKTQVSFKQSISPVASHLSHKTLTKSTSIVQPPVTKSPLDKKGSLIHRQKRSLDSFEQEVLRLKRLKVKADGIMRAKKVFVVQGPYRSVRSSLRRRGWVEQMYKGPYGDVDTTNSITKSPVKKNNKSKADSTSSDDSSDTDSDGSCSDSDTELSDEEDYCILSRAVKNSLPFFIWTCKRDDFYCRHLRKDQMVNHFEKAASLTTKVGLYTNLQNLPWFRDVNPNTFFPRCYRLCNQEEKHVFIDDYRLTAAISLLKVLIDQLTSQCSNHPSRCSTPHNCPPPSRPQSCPSSQPSSSRRSTPTIAIHKVVPEVAFSLAVQAAEYFVGFEEHYDIDSETSLCPPLSDSEWDSLIDYHHDAIFNNCQFICSSSLAARAKMLLVQLRQHLPQLTMDGMRNIWILKPGAKSRGRGISCLDRLEEILAVVSNPVQMKESKWIIQKYIETPLLIYDTKFDIRQWFLVTDWNPLTMWMYKDCYLRFCTQQFNLEDLDISIHLANNCIQKNYTNSPTRSSQLPPENMWDCEQFKKYLSSIGVSPSHWENVIYTGMKNALINAVQVTQDDTDYQRNAFELYGADFMITTDLKPWLIEINCSPSMCYSTSITKRLCKAVQEDTIKVVIDRKLEKNCDTGNFEMVYKQQKMGIPSYVGVQLCVEGFSVKRINGSGSRTTRPELTRSQTPKLTRQELSLKGTKCRTRSQAGYRENIEA